jgi:hypothetical protein
MSALKSKRGLTDESANPPFFLWCRSRDLNAKKLLLTNMWIFQVFLLILMCISSSTDRPIAKIRAFFSIIIKKKYPKITSGVIKRKPGLNPDFWLTTN